MKFKCYDVVEIKGKRYVVGEVISYQEFIVDKTIRYALNDENYKKELGISKGAQSWTEYGLLPVSGNDKLLIRNDLSDYVSLSLNLYNIITLKLHISDSSAIISFKSLISSFVNDRSNKSGRNNRVRFSASF